MKISDIKIQDDFKISIPSNRKLQKCREYFKKYGTIDREIVVNKNDYLVDGYIGYLVLLENGIEDVEVVSTNQNHVNKKVYVFGCHDGNDKEYVWRMPKKVKVDDNIVVGSKILVHTKFGIKTITVTRIETLYYPPVSMPVKKVIRCLT